MFNYISKLKKQKKNTELFLTIASDFIKNNSNKFPSCHNDLMDELIKYCAECKNEFEVWEYNKDEYEKSAVTIIANLSFEMLASGKYHLYKGFLNPMNCSGDLRNIYNCAMQWSVNKGYITKEFLEEEAQVLSSFIYNIG